MTLARSVWDMTLAEFRDAIESRSMPGCGAAASATAAVGLALVLKGLRITEAKAPDKERAALIERADAVLGTLGDTADEDVQAFNAYLDARKRARDDKTGDSALDAALERINGVPLEAARRCLDGLALAAPALTLTRASLHSDTHAGARLLHAGLTTVLLNVDANTAGQAAGRERDRLIAARQGLQQCADRELDALGPLAPDD